MATVTTTPTVTIDELRVMIPAIGEELTPVIQSEPGCGKTSLLSMLAEDNGDKWRKAGQPHYESDKYDYIYVDCPVKDIPDISMTIPDHATKTLDAYVGALFNMKSNKPKIILLDEFMKAPKLLQITFTRLILERMVGDSPLPEGSIVFATSNNASDGVGDSMLAHAGNRVCIVRMQKPTKDEWLPWAEKHGIHPLIRTWVHMFPRALASYLDGNQSDNPYIFQPAKGMLSFCSPRSLAKSSVIVKKRDVLGDNATMVALAGTIGASAAGDMAAFLALEKQLPKFSDILDKPSSIEVPNEPAALLMLMNQAVDTLQTQEELTKFMTFVNRMASSELQAVFFTMMVRHKNGVRLARSNQQIAEWATKNHELF